MPYRMFILKYLLTSWVTGRICRALLTSYGRETRNQWRLLAHTIKHVNRTDVADVVRDLELAVSTGAFSMHNTLWDTLTIEVS